MLCINNISLNLGEKKIFHTYTYTRVLVLESYSFRRKGIGNSITKVVRKITNVWYITLFYIDHKNTNFS